MENAIKELNDSGLRVVVAGAQSASWRMHYLNRAGILVIKILSKFELSRLCRVVGASPLARLGAPMPDEMGNIDIVETIEIGGDRVTVFRQENEQTRTATMVLRGATQNHLDDVERAVDDGVNVVKAITKDPRLVPGAGAAEMQLIERISAIRRQDTWTGTVRNTKVCRSVRSHSSYTGRVGRSGCHRGSLQAIHCSCRVLKTRYQRQEGGGRR